MTLLQLEPHRTWQFVDSSKLSEWQTCGRRYFYRYILGWTPEGRSLALEFGTAWHEAMAYLLQHGLTKENLQPAIDAFISEWGSDPAKGDTYRNLPKALIALSSYIDHYAKQDLATRVLHIEAAGTIPVGLTNHDSLILRNMAFRLDGVVQNAYGVYALEHKTTGRLTRVWPAQWPMKHQINLYTHVIRSLYNNAASYGVIVNGTAISSNIEFLRVPISKSPAMLDSWLESANSLIDEIEAATRNLMENNSISLFKQNPNSCTAFMTQCPYLDLCRSWAKPLDYIKDGTQPPIGQVIEWWDPHDRIETAKERMTLP